MSDAAEQAHRQGGTGKRLACPVRPAGGKAGRSEEGWRGGKMPEIFLPYTHLGEFPLPGREIGVGMTESPPGTPQPLLTFGHDFPTSSIQMRRLLVRS
jgi:hypothetical protein